MEPNTDRLSWLYPDGQIDAQVQDHITINDYLTIFGAEAEFPTEEDMIISTMCFLAYVKSGQVTP
ncbi:hypothetical protein JCM19231_4783 [Vibrio ishigakensis]|uniref:Uncharacterized protein n=1 Tax=Vibrio ishigakensis TaxID=1481914 RepID=A0A0B8NZ69_9VIBR|nr:hypothetical protein JCM19231_4783 [Vibrio ishigakensis]